MLLGLTGAGRRARCRCAACPCPRAAREALARVGAIVEEPHFHGHLTGRENLRVLAAVRGPETFARIDGALARVGLAERADEKVSRYSQGMRQRLGVARCLLADPELLILDEPTNGLDPAGILEFRQMIRALVGEGRTVFLSSHLLDEVEKACDAAAIIDGGRIVTSGPIAELDAQPPRRADRRLRRPRRARSSCSRERPACSRAAHAERGPACALRCAARRRRAGSTAASSLAGIARLAARAGPRARSRSASSRSPRVWRSSHDAVTFRQMVAAELLQAAPPARRSSPIAAFFTVGIVVLYFGVRGDPARRRPAAATARPAASPASTARSSCCRSSSARSPRSSSAPRPGPTDLSSGVFRDLVVTGRSRLWLFAVRVPAALIVTLGAGAGGARRLARRRLRLRRRRCRRRARPSCSTRCCGCCGAQALLCVIAVGLGSLTGSRAASLTTLIGWEVIAGRLLVAGSPSSAASATLIPNVALGALKPGDPLPDTNGVVPSVTVAIVVIAAWIVVSLFLGARSTPRARPAHAREAAQRGVPRVAQAGMPRRQRACTSTSAA